MSKSPKKEKTMAKTDRMTMAECILAMPYTELIAVSEALANLKHARRLETKEDFAALLNEWAQGQ
jgi:hypothetical protein